VVLMDWHKATKVQLLHLALEEDCPLDYKYKACAELQMRWNNDMLTDVVIMYGKGYSPKEIADYLGISCEMIGGIISKYNLRRAKVGFTKAFRNAERARCSY
jgi:hypothetical protein